MTETTPSNSLYVVGLPLDSTKNTLKDLFSKFGKVIHCACLDPREGRNTKIAFIDFETVEEAVSAKSSLSHIKIYFSKKKHTTITGPSKDNRSNHSITPFNNTIDYATGATCGPPERVVASHQSQLMVPYSKSIEKPEENPEDNLMFKNIHAIPSHSHKVLEIRGSDIVISIKNTQRDLSLYQPASPSISKVFCIICAKRAFFRCGACRMAYYCSENCQVFDWMENSHRTFCRKDPINLDSSSYFSSVIQRSSLHDDSESVTERSRNSSISGINAISEANGHPVPVSKPRRLIPKALDHAPLRKPRLMENTQMMASTIQSNVEIGKVQPLEKLNLVESVIVPEVSLPAQHLVEGDKVVACFGTNPYKFYAQKFSDADDLKIITEKLQNESKENSFKPNVNSICAARYEDGEWYRAKIQKISGNTVEVFFLDFGNVDSILVSKLSSINNDLTKFSAKAFCLSLVNIKPKNNESDFPTEIIVKFNQLLQSSAFTVKKAIKTNNGAYSVELEDDMGKNLSESLISEKLADPVSKYLLKSPTEKSKLEKSTFKLQDQSLNIGDEVILCYGDNPQSFFLHKFMDADELQQISTELLEGSLNSCGKAEAGLFCVAKYTDGLFYRGRIEQKLENNQFEIFFLDYGNVETVNLSDLKQIPTTLKFSPKAFKCCLQSFQASSNLDCKAINEKFQLMVINQAFTVKTVSSENGVFLVELSTAKKEDLSELLKISSPLALKQNVDKNIVREDQVGNSKSTHLKQNEVLKSRHDKETTTAQLQATVPSQKTALPLPKTVLTVPKTITISSLPKQSLNNGEKVILCYGSDPLCFFVHKVLDLDDIPTISTVLNNKDKSGKSTFKPEVGTLCSALFEDQLWYRARIDEDLADGNFLVFFLDFGNVAVTNILELDFLPEELASISQKAYLLRLKVKPKNQEVLFNNEIKENFHMLINGFALIVQTATCCNSVFTVELKDEEDNDIANLLITSQLADAESLLPSDEKVVHASNLIGQNVQVSSVSQSNLNGPILSTCDIVPNSKTTMVFSTEFQSVNCVNQADIPLTVNCLPKPDLALGDEVMLCHSNNPTDFYVQKISDIDKVTSITEVLQRTKLDQPSSFKVECGSLCVAKFDEDGALYRAIIEKVLGQNLYEAYFLDYGNKSNVAFSALTCIPDELLKFSPMAFGLRLKVCPIDNSNEFSTSVNDTFTTLINSVPLVLTDITNHGNSFTVNLRDEEQNDIANLLINFKMAQAVSSVESKELDSDKTKLLNSVPLLSLESLPTQTLVSGDEVLLSHGDDPTDFYVQKLSNALSLKAINEVLQNQSGKLETIPDAQSGTLCLAKYEDDSWNRAVVLEALDNSNFTIFFVDYGNSAPVDKMSLVCFPDELLKFPPMAIRLKLKVQPLNNSEEFASEVKESFYMLINGIPLFVTDATKDGNFYLVDLKDETNNDIVEILIKIEMAVTKENSVSTVRDKTIPSLVSYSFTISSLPNQNLNPGDKVLLSNGNDPLNFSVQKFCDAEKLVVISECIKAHLVKTGLTTVIPKIGLLCAAKFSDNEWYRANIERIINQDSVEVVFIDFGNSDHVETKNLCTLPEEALVYEPMSFLVCLADIQPLNADTKFSIGAKNFFDSILNEVPVYVQTVEFKGGYYQVELKNEQGSLISDALITRNFAKKSGTSSEKLVEITDFKPEPNTEPNNVLTSKSSNPIVPVDNDLTVSPTKVPKLSFMTDRPKILPKHTLTVGHEDEICVVWISELRIYVHKKLELPELEKVMRNLKKYCTNQQPNKENLPLAGDIVCSRFSDGEWYRAKVVSIKESNSIQVFFIDYGNTELVSTNDILPLPKQAFQYHPYTYCVNLKDVINIDEGLTNLFVNEAWIMKVLSINASHLENQAEALVEFKSTSEIVNKMLRSKINPGSDEKTQAFLNMRVSKLKIEPSNLEIGQNVTLFVNDISDATSIACRIIDGDEKDFNNMISNIQEKCSKTPLNPTYKPSIRDFILAKRPEDGKWYRASAVLPPRNDAVDVFFVDFGTWGSVPLGNILPMIKIFTQMKSQGVLCTIQELRVQNWGDVKPKFQEFLNQSCNIIKGKVTDFDKSQNMCEISCPSVAKFFLTLVNV